MSAAEQLQNPGFLLAEAHRQLKRAFAARTDELSLSLSQAKALILISKHQGVKQRELADHLEIKPMTMAKLIDQLAEMELVCRKPDPNDRRAHLILLTEKAEPIVIQVKKTTQSFIEEVFQDLSDEENQELVRMLNVVRNRLMSL